MIDSKMTPGYHVGKGEELGYFSTALDSLRRLPAGAIAGFALAAIPQAPLVLVRSKLATANPSV